MQDNRINSTKRLSSSSHDRDLRVVKVGGSLIGYSPLIQRLTTWLENQPAFDTLFIAGGGTLADKVRDVDKKHSMAPRVAHDLAIQAMSVNSLGICHRLTECQWFEKLSDWQVRRSERSVPRAIVDPTYFMRDEEPHCCGEPLPCGWHVTSDSIAARLATIVGATELVLIKSALPGESDKLSATEASESGFVDAHFPTASQGLDLVRAVDLREPDFREVQLVG